MSTEKRRRNKVGVGTAATRPTITNSGVSFGDEYIATDTGVWSKVTSDAAGAKQWTTFGVLGAGLQYGTDTLAGGQKTVAATMSTTSRLLISRRTAPAAAIGSIVVTAPAPGVAAASFDVSTVVATTGAGPVATDVSTFDWLVVS